VNHLYLKKYPTFRLIIGNKWREKAQRTFLRRIIIYMTYYLIFLS